MNLVQVSEQELMEVDGGLAGTTITILGITISKKLAAGVFAGGFTTGVTAGATAASTRNR